MKSIVYIYLLLLFSNTVVAQTIEGLITDTSGKPLDAVTVIIPLLNQGLITNAEGRFKVKVNPGNYTLICRHPGYKDVQFTIVAGSDNRVEEFVLKKDTLHTGLKDISQSKLAEAIIRESIIKAPSYFDVVKWYESENYQTGILTLKNVHSLIDNASYRFGKVHVSEFKDKALFQEIYYKTEFIFPDFYKTTVDGINGSIPGNFTDKGAMDIQNGSIYANRFGNFISPLSHNAFRFYKFRYIGYYNNEGNVYHRIRIEPKVKDPELLSGDLYIEDSSWKVYFAVLKSESQGLETTTSISYHDFGDDISLPVSYFSDAKFNLLLSKGIIRYYTAVKYDNISRSEIDLDLPEDEEPVKKQVSTNESASKREDAFWDNHRLQPLIKDSTYQMISVPDRTHINFSKFWLGKVMLGDYIAGNDTTRFSLKYNGVKYIFRDYNYVDGFWLGNKFDLKYDINGKTNIEAYPYIYYVTGRNRILGGSDITYNYNRRRRGQLALNFGSRSDDFNNLSLTRYQNYFASLVFGENYNFFYQRDFINVSNSIHLNKKIKVAASIGAEKRSGLSNHTDFNILGRNRIKDNIFPNDRFDRTYYSVGVSYSPNSYYSITEALDMYEKKVTPVLSIEYQEAFSSWQTNNSTYKKLKGGFSHNIELDYFNWIDYKVEGGVFFDKGANMHFTDYQHFGASDLLLNLNSLFDSFLLLDNYELQTNRYWVNLFLNYSGKYVLMKYIPFLQGKPFTENIHLKTLFTPDIKSYVETGYSISFNRHFGIGTFVSFHNAKTKKIGIRFSLNLRAFKFT